MFSEKKGLDDHHDDGQDKHKKGQPVNPMHKPHRPGMGFVGIPLPEIEILGYLSPYSHSKRILFLPRQAAGRGPKLSKI